MHVSLSVCVVTDLEDPAYRLNSKQSARRFSAASGLTVQVAADEISSLKSLKLFSISYEFSQEKNLVVITAIGCDMVCAGTPQKNHTNYYESVHVSLVLFINESIF